MYDKSTFTYGMEIEWGDVPRNIEIPEHLGAWEYSERDIVNLRHPYQNVCADPLGQEPPVGGEINTKPSKTWQEQVDRYYELADLFNSHAAPPTIGATAHTHIHVRVPGLRDDIHALKRLTQYVLNNQDEAIDKVYRFREDIMMQYAKGSKMYLKLDGGRRLPEYIAQNIFEKATDFDSFIKMHAAGKDGISMGRPFRYAINMYSMKHLDTIEFRLFRGTMNREELTSCFRFVEAFMDAALNEGPGVGEIIFNNALTFPDMIWNLDQFTGWNLTKHDEKRGKKVRTYVDV